MSRGIDWIRSFARGSLAPVLLGVIVAFALLAALPAIACAKSYTMGPVDIDATVHPDGRLTVTERRLFAFDGDFSKVFWDLDTSGITITDVTIGEVLVDGSVLPYRYTDEQLEIEGRVPGQYSVIDAGSTIEAAAYFRKDSEDLVIELGYTVVDGVKRHEDIAELYWQAVGRGWGENSNDVTVRIQLPVTAETTVVAGENVKVWAHGPLTGEINVDAAGLVTATVPRVAPGEFVEPRVAFPQEWLPDAPITPGVVLPDILEEEMGWAEEANVARDRAKKLVGAANWGIPAAGAGLLGAMFLAWRKWGKEYKPDFDQPYWREVPDDLPAGSVGALMNWGTVSNNDFTATLMDLSARGIVKLERVQTMRSTLFGSRAEEDYQIRLVPEKAGDAVDPIDREAIDLIFREVGNGSDTVMFKQFEAFGKRNPQRFTSAFDSWKAAAGAPVRQRGYIESNGMLVGVPLLILVFLLGFAAFAAGASLGTWIPLASTAIVFVGALILTINMRRRSREGAELHAKYSALKSYLQDFSKLDDAIPQQVVLWERFLVLAVVFGIADQVIKQMRIVVPEVLQDPAFVPVYMWMNPAGGMASPANAIGNSIQTASQAAVAATSASSGGGFGGGFSGGGGGGFGGGGGGAN